MPKPDAAYAHRQKQG